MPQHAKFYRQAIRRKGAFEAEQVFESEVVPMSKLPKAVASPSLSPVSIVAPMYMPEIQPLKLPGAWTVVGKGGKALKEYKMYDDPKKPKKSKKKARGRKSVEDEPFIAVLTEAPSSSKCYDKCARSAAQHNKEVTRARDAKFWERYRQQKAEKLEAHAALLVTLADADKPCDDLDVPSAPLQERKPRHSNKANTAKEKTRRANRFASAAARCYSLDEEEDVQERETHSAEIKQPQTKATSPTKAPKAQARPHAAKPKVQVATPPQSSDVKRKASSEASTSEAEAAANKPHAEPSKRSKKDKSCSVM